MRYSYIRLALVTSVLAVLFTCLSGPERSVSAGPGVASCDPAPIGLLAWWPADGNALDVRSRLNGTLTGGTYVAGKNGQGFHFNAGEKLSATDSGGALNAIGSEITIEAWIKLEPNAIHPNRDISAYIGKEGFPGEPFAMLFETGTIGGGAPGPQLAANQHQVEYILTNSSGTRVHNQRTGVIATADGNYHHFAVTYRSSDPVTSNVKIYIDGVLQATNINTVSDQISGNIKADTSIPVSIGALGSTGNGTSIDETALYNRALSAAEIGAIVNAGASGKCKPTATTAPAGTVGWWGGDGDPRDISGNNNNGLLNGGAAFAVGKVGQAFSFNGTGSFVSTPSPPTTATDNWTMETWMNPSNLSQQGMVMSNGFDDGSTGNGYSFGIGNGCTGSGCGSGNKLQGLLNGVAFLDGGFTFPNANAWYHVVMLRDSGTVKFYVDGVQTPSTSTATPTAPTEFRIGGQNGVRFFNGLVDEPTVYNRALTVPEIQSIFSAGLAGKLKSRFTGFAGDRPASRGRTGTVMMAPDGFTIITTVGDATVTFPSGNGQGQTQEIPLSLTGLPPLPMPSAGLTYDIATTFAYSGSPTVCFNVPAFTPAQFADLRIEHLENNVWMDRTNPTNTYPNLCTSGLPSLSPFAIVTSAPTAANVSVGGRVTTSAGAGIKGALVSMADAFGNKRSALTNSFGYYRMDDVPAGASYVIGVTAKRYQFADRLVTVDDDMTSLDFTPE
jgi:hypothetical protein